MAGMKICVDRGICAGHALCAAKAPDVYTLDDEGYCSSDGQHVPPHLIDLARLGARHCPEGAITLIEDDSPQQGTAAAALANVVFIQHDGTEHAVRAAPGSSLMQIALDNGVPGIVADCGGCRSCATCHGYVDEAWFDRLPPASSDELELVSYAFDPLPNSRLTCQVVLTPELDGIVVRLPNRQI